MVQGAGSFPGRRIRILLVEDDDNDLRTLRLEIARRLGDLVEVSEVCCGEDAVTCISNEDTHYDIVVLDYGLPDINGTEVLSKFKQLGHEKVTIGLTRLGGNVLEDMKAACAVNAFSKADWNMFIEYLAYHAEQLSTSGS